MKKAAISLLLILCYYGVANAQNNKQVSIANPNGQSIVVFNNKILGGQKLLKLTAKEISGIEILKELILADHVFLKKPCLNINYLYR